MGNMLANSGGAAASDYWPLLNPQGRLWVPPAYMQTSGDTAVDLLSAAHAVAFRFVPEVDFGLFSVSFYLTAVSVTGNCTISLHEDSAGSPGAKIGADLANVAVGSSADVWLRAVWSTVQVYRNRIYWLKFTGEAGKNFSLSARRWNTSIGSMFPDGCRAKQTSDGTGWTECAQDQKPALLNVVLNSTANHCPQLIYGRFNGPKLPLYNGADAWAPATIPEAGVVLNCEALAANTGFNVFLYDNAGALTLEAVSDATAPVMQDGIEVKSAATQRRLVGGMYAIERRPGFRAPIDVPDWRGVDNLHNPRPRKIAKYCPYASDTQETIPGNTQWRPWQNDTSFRINFYCARSTNLRALASIQVVCCDVALQLDAISGLHPCTAIGVTTNVTHFNQVKSLETQLSAGFHYVIPMAQAAGVPTTAYLFYHKDTAVAGGGSDYSSRAQIHGELSF
jgi:hypothetical protein